MKAYLVRRLLHAALTLLLCAVLVFLAVRLLPNNPVLARYKKSPVPQQVQAEMHRQGWARPIAVQLANYLRGLLLRGDLGESFSHPGESVAKVLGDCIPATIELTMAALLIALPLGVALGTAGALWRNKLPDAACTTAALVGMSVPVFFLGYCLIRLFPFGPTSGRLSPLAPAEFRVGFTLWKTAVAGRWDLFAEAIRHLILPAMALATIPLSIVARITRAAVIEVLSADYVRTARAKGLSAWRVVLRHVLPNAAVPVANIAGFQVGSLLSGAVLTETVFAWPGMGRMLSDAVQNSDYAEIQAGAVVVAGIFVLLNLGLDLLYLVLDPRIRFE